jgi:hypothetical protein
MKNKFHNLHPSQNIKQNEMGGTCSTNWRYEKCTQNFGRKTEGKRPLRKPRSRWKDDIRLDLREIGQTGVDWMHLA